MPDRRMGDRREPEEGVIRINFKDAVWYIILGVLLVISISANIVLGINNRQYKNRLDFYEENYYVDDDYDEEFYEDEDYENEVENNTNILINE